MSNENRLAPLPDVSVYHGADGAVVIDIDTTNFPDGSPGADKQGVPYVRVAINDDYVSKHDPPAPLPGSRLALGLGPDGHGPNDQQATSILTPLWRPVAGIQALKDNARRTMIDGPAFCAGVDAAVAFLAPPPAAVVYVVRPDDSSEDVAVFEREEDAEAFAATYEHVGDVENATVCDPALASRMIADRQNSSGVDEATEAITPPSQHPRTQLAVMLAQARTDVIADDEHWTHLACGQDSEEAEESARLAGYAEGLEAAWNLMYAPVPPADVTAAVDGRREVEADHLAIAALVAANGWPPDSFEVTQLAPIIAFIIERGDALRGFQNEVKLLAGSGEVAVARQLLDGLQALSDRSLTSFASDAGEHMCVCGHRREQHTADTGLAGDTRCLVVGDRESVPQRFDDGRDREQGYCACLRFTHPPTGEGSG